MPDPPFARGEILAGKYRIEQLLGEGGHGVVVAARHLTLNERVAIKVLRPEVAEDPETVARFLREARAAVRIKGEHVTRVLDVGSLPNGTPYMVMEHLAGADLATILEAKGWLPVSLAVDYMLQTCEALAEAHGLGIVHRDIKPSNLFLTTRPDGSPCIKVLDFGISKAVAPDGQGADMNLTQTQTVLGSPQYMAPEQMRSSKRVDGRTDIWAIGVTLHELLTGCPPFEAKTMPELFAMILQDTPPRLAERRPAMPEALEAIVARCLEKSPDKRFADVYELACALAPLGSSAGAEAVERIGRVGFNAARSSERMLPVDAGSAPGVDLSRTAPNAKTERMVTTDRRVKPATTVWFASIAALLAIIGLTGIVLGVQQMRGQRSAPKAEATTLSASPPPPVDSSSAPPVGVEGEPRPAASSEPPPAAPADESPPAIASAPPEVAKVAPKAASTAAKSPAPPARPPPSAASAQRAPSATTAAPPPPPPPPTRAPGVASSRYD